MSAAAPSLWRPSAASFVYDPLDNLRLSKVGTRSCTHEYNALNRLTSISGANCLTVSYGNFRVNRSNVRPGRKYGFEWDQVSGAVTYKLVQTYSNCPGHAQTVWDLPENVAQPWELTGAIPQWGPPPAPAQAQFQYTIQACSTTQCSEKSPSLTVTVSQTEARAAGPAYYHTDALGSPVVQTDAAGQEIADSRRRYEPYGKTLGALAPADQGPGYTGHVTDVLTGFSYMQQRYYDPLAGRFLSTDPIPASSGSFNRYTYANDNPYRFTDPDGRLPDCAPRCSPEEIRAYTDAKALVVIKLWAVPAATGATWAVATVTGLTAETVAGAQAAWRYARSDEGRAVLCLATSLACTNPANLSRGSNVPPKREPELDVVTTLERRTRINETIDRSVEGEKFGNRVELDKAAFQGAFRVQGRVDAARLKQKLDKN